MRIAHFGTFDVDNYGDLLFPLLLEKRLAGLGAEFLHVSPTGEQPSFPDARPTISIAEGIAQFASFDGAVLGGGNLLHDGNSKVPAYQATGYGHATYPALWTLPSLLACYRGIPALWNASGVGKPLEGDIVKPIVWAAQNADYLCVRDRSSHDRLLGAGCESEIAVCVDTALEIRDLWDEASLRSSYDKLFERKGQKTPRRSIAFHLRSWYLGTSPAEAAEIIDRICQKQAATPILLGIGNCHGDDALAKAVAQQLESPALVQDDPDSLQEIAAAIAFSSAYIGSSLHGTITAYSFGIRALVIAPRKRRKFDGFLEQVGGEKWMAESLPGLLEIVDDFFDAPPEFWKTALERNKPNLNGHWAHVAKTLRNPAKQSENKHSLNFIDGIPSHWIGLHLLFVPLYEHYHPEAIREHRESTFLVKALQEIQERYLEARSRSERKAMEQGSKHEAHITHLEHEQHLLTSEQRELHTELKNLKRQLKEAEHDNRKLRKGMDQIRRATDALYSDRRWRLANLFSGRSWSRSTPFIPLERAMERMPAPREDGDPQS